MKLYPIFCTILTENNNLSNGNYWVDDNGRFNRFSHTHAQFVYRNIEKFDPPENVDVDILADPYEPGGNEFFFYNLAFDKGWVRLVMANSSVGKTANIEFNPKTVDQKAIENTFDSVLASKVATLYVDTIEDAEDYDPERGDVFRFSENEREIDRLFRKFRKYLR